MSNWLVPRDLNEATLAVKFNRIHQYASRFTTKNVLVTFSKTMTATPETLEFGISTMRAR